MSTHKIFLSREGQTFGPISDSELRKLRESGRLLDYAWIWQSPEAGWQALHAMPSAPVESEAREMPAEAAPVRELPRHAPAQAAPQRKPTRTVERPLEAVLHDFHHLVTGQIKWVSDGGCQLSCASEETPQFREKAPLVLNLLDPATGMTMNVRAKLGQVSRQQGKWTYELSWDAMPEILAA